MHVWAYDNILHRPRLVPVAGVFNYTTSCQNLVSVITNSSSISTIMSPPDDGITVVVSGREHLFRDISGGWVSAGSLLPGSLVQTCTDLTVISAVMKFSDEGFSLPADRGFRTSAMRVLRSGGGEHEVLPVSRGNLMKGWGIPLDKFLKGWTMKISNVFFKHVD